MDRATRRHFYNLCDPAEALPPGDPRNVDIDASGVRGARWAECRRTVTDNALRWLARVHLEKRLIIDDDGHRETVDLMLQNNVVLRYQNDDPWVDLHPAIREMPEVVAELARLRAQGAVG